MFQKLVWLSIAGACGTVSRFALCEVASRFQNGHLGLGTFAVNVIGSFLFGLVYALAGRKLPMGPEFRPILLTGFMGAFTTFSSLAFDTARLLKASQWALAVGNVAGQVVLGVSALVVGVFVGYLL